MRVTAIRVKTERKRQDKSARCAEKRRRWAGMLRVWGAIRPTSDVRATTDAARGGKRLINGRSQAIFTSEGRPLEECRSKPDANFTPAKLDRLHKIFKTKCDLKN